MEKIAVIGAGAWGTTLAKIISENGYTAHIWAYDEFSVSEINNGENRTFLPGVKLPDIKASKDIKTVLSGTSAIFMAVPSRFFKVISGQCRDFFTDGIPVVSATKGFDKSGERMSEILSSHGVASENLFVLSGPNLAGEIALKIPSSTVVGYDESSSAEKIQKILMTDYFRVYTCNDLIGVELGGCLKNIIVIASGICDGLRLGANTKAALLTRGLAEMTRLAVEMGAKPYTFAGLSGIGDLMATSMSTESRNRSFGEKIASGISAEKIIQSQKQVVEGMYTAETALNLAEKYEVSMPITREVCNIIFNRKNPVEALKDLMMRSPKEEVY